MGLADITHKYGLSNQEIRNYAIVIVCLSFIFSFNQWGETEFSIASGMLNWAIAAIIAVIAVLAHDTGHRIVAIVKGEKIKYVLSRNALLISFLLSFLSNGAFTVLLGGYLKTSPLKRAKLGRYPAMEDPTTLWTLSIAGPAANLILAALATILISVWDSQFLYKFAVFNGLYGLFNLVPISHFDGFQVFYYSRPLFAGIAIAFFVYVLLLITGTPSLLLAILLGIAGCVAWWLAFER